MCEYKFEYFHLKRNKCDKTIASPSKEDINNAVVVFLVHFLNFEETFILGIKNEPSFKNRE